MKSPLRAFVAGSWWNTPLDAGLAPGNHAPVDAANASMLAAVAAAVSLDYLVLTGTPVKSPEEAQPVYLPVSTDTLYHIVPSQTGPTVDVRIPAGAVGNGGTLPKLTILDTTTNQAVGLVNGLFSGGVWTANGTDRYWLDGNGVDDSASPAGTTGDDGHRGATFACKASRLAEVRCGAISHRIEGFVRPYKTTDTLGLTGDTGVWPMTGSDGDPPGGAIEEGQVFRIKASVNLAAKPLSRGARVIAKCLQDYGIVITDGGGVNMTHRLEWADPFGDPTWQQTLWTNIDVKDDSLSSIPLSTDWEFVQAGYRPPGSLP